MRKYSLLYNSILNCAGSKKRCYWLKIWEQTRNSFIRKELKRNVSFLHWKYGLRAQYNSLALDPVKMNKDTMFWKVLNIEILTTKNKYFDIFFAKIHTLRISDPDNLAVRFGAWDRKMGSNLKREWHLFANNCALFILDTIYIYIYVYISISIYIYIQWYWEKYWKLKKYCFYIPSF